MKRRKIRYPSRRELYELVTQEWYSLCLEEGKEKGASKGEEDEVIRQLLKEFGITTTVIEEYYVPFGHRGYLSEKQMFFIILWIFRKQYGRSAIERLGEELLPSQSSGYCFVTEELIKRTYYHCYPYHLKELGEEDKQQLFLQEIKFHQLEKLVDYLLEYCPKTVFSGNMIQKEWQEMLGIEVNKRKLILPFLRFTQEEMKMGIRRLVIRGRYGELTAKQAIWEGSLGNGYYLQATRPPMDDWKFQLSRE